MKSGCRKYAWVFSNCRARVTCGVSINHVWTQRTLSLHVRYPLAIHHTHTRQKQKVQPLPHQSVARQRADWVSTFTSTSHRRQWSPFKIRLSLQSTDGRKRITSTHSAPSHCATEASASLLRMEVLACQTNTSLPLVIFILYFLCVSLVYLSVTLLPCTV